MENFFEAAISLHHEVYTGNEYHILTLPGQGITKNDGLDPPLQRQYIAPVFDPLFWAILGHLSLVPCPLSLSLSLSCEHGERPEGPRTERSFGMPPP